jgi:hypothetical protein
MKPALAAALVFAATIGHGFAAADAKPRIAGPYGHDNLTIFLIQADSADAGSAAAAQYMTLDEALADKQAIVYETGDVNELAVENLSKARTLFVQAGDIVKGGRQDRVLSVDLVLPPNSGRTPIAAFCVEHGRWSGRGDEPAANFASAGKSLAGTELKLAAKTARSQQDVWNAVARAQARLAASLGEDVAAPASPTSLQLTLENSKLADAVAAHIAALQRLAEEDTDAVGYVYAVNGEISGGDVYDSPVLFRRLWPRLLEASATEAVAARAEASSGAAVTADNVLAFLAAADDTTPIEEALPAGITLVTRDGDSIAALETRAGAAWIHRSYVAK